jgi:hypothetical protein
MKRTFQIVAAFGILMSQAFFPLIGATLSNSAEVKQCTHNGKSYPPGSQVCINSHIHECDNDGRWMDLRRFC